MKSNRNKLIALGVGWFVLFNILLSTTESATSTIFSSTSSFRSLIRGFGYSYLVLGGGIIALIILFLLSMLILIYLLRAWSSIINLTKILVRYFFIEDKTTPENSTEAEKTMVQALFGDATVSDKPLFWLALRSLLALWVLIVLFALASGVVNLLSNY